MGSLRSDWWFLFNMPDEKFDGASCTTSEVDPDWWTETMEDVGDARVLRKHQRSAMQVCMTCPCQRQCAAYALRHPELQGIWGGTNEKQRRDLRTNRRYTTLQIVY